MKSSTIIEEALQKCAADGHIIPRSENNKYLKVSYKGAGKLLSDKWNVKIYSTGTINTTDEKNTP